MTGEHNKEFEKAVKKVQPHGWREVGSRGYKVKMHCECGEHQAWLPKTPSNPHKFRELANQMIRTCSTQASGS